MSNAVQPFALRGNTRRLAATPRIATVAIKVSQTADVFPQARNYILTNFGPSVAFVGFGPDSATAITNAKAPTATDTTGEFCYVLPPGQRGIEAAPGAWFAAVTESGTADILITPGYGMVDGFGDGAASSTAASGAALAELVNYAFGPQQEMFNAILIELRTQTEFLRQGLNVTDSPDLVRADQAPLVN